MDVYIQFGSNVGNDCFFKEMCALEKKSKIILIEPDEDAFKELIECYKELKNIHDIHFLNLGIVHDKKIKKFIIYPSSVNNSFINRNHFIKSNNIKNIDTITFDELCSKYNINNIKKLSIDCEGYDYSLINSIDFLKYKIEEINCEIWPHDYDSTTEIPTGPYFFENTLKPKILQFYTISDYEIDGMPSYKFELKV